MPPHLPGSYWVAILGGIFLVIQGLLVLKAGRETSASADLRALVEALQEENARRIKEIGSLQAAYYELQEEHHKMGLRFDIEVGVRQKAELDRDHCIGALARERELNIAHVAVIEKLKADVHERDTQLVAANDYALRLRAEIHVLDPEHPEAVAPHATVP